jgi:hypothetical protein
VATFDAYESGEVVDDKVDIPPCFTGLQLSLAKWKRRLPNPGRMRSAARRATTGEQ